MLENGRYGLPKHFSYEFPHYTFEDHNFSQFMIRILNALEYRLYLKDQIIVNELEECIELLFVEKGRYNIGYEINKKSYFPKQRGPMTIIGGYQICNNKRYEFIYKA